MELIGLRFIKQAYGLVRTNRFLWYIGLFLVWELLLVLLIIFSQSSEQSRQSEIDTWVNSNQNLSVFFGAILLAFILFLWYLHFRSKAALIVAVDNLVNKKLTNFSLAYQGSAQYFSKLVGSTVFIGFVTTVILLAFIFPVVYLADNNLTARAVNLGVIATIILLPIIIFVCLVNIFSPIFITLYGMKVKQAIKSSFDIIIKNWGPLLAIGSMIFMIGIITLFFSLFLVFLIAIPFVQFQSQIIALGGKTLMLTLGIATTILALFAFFLVNGFYLAFAKTVWVLVFLKYIKPQKFEEGEEPAIVPEVAA